ncbi:MAG: hydantoinase/oxoprolinase N-terminal domain-containing protein [Candidatus Entotheonellia bacterium]
MRQIVGVDVGGTYTDLVLMDEEGDEIQVAKVFSTPGDQSIGLMAGLAQTGVSPQDLMMLAHGTTVATNAVIERRGARCGLMTTRGFRDVIELRRRDRPSTYGLIGEFTPLIPREHRLEVDERVLLRGRVSLQKADVVQLRTPGGGGYGDPRGRDPTLILQDVQRGYISRRVARQEYGVVVRGGKVDWAATEALRAAR